MSEGRVRAEDTQECGCAYNTQRNSKQGLQEMCTHVTAISTTHKGWKQHRRPQPVIHPYKRILPILQEEDRTPATSKTNLEDALQRQPVTEQHTLRDSIHESQVPGDRGEWGPQGLGAR